MASINDVADRLAELVTARTGLPCTQIVDAPHPPCVMIYPDDIGDTTYFEAFQRGVVKYRMVLHVLAPSMDVAGQQRLLNDIISPFGARSIPEAIYRNPTLGTSATEAPADSTTTMTASVGALTEYGFVEAGGARFLQAKLRVDVLTRGDR